MNKVMLMGRLTREPDIRYSQGENAMAIARYTLAVDRRCSRSGNGGNDQSADFISCVAFGRSAEFAEKYLHQGTKIVADRSYPDGKLYQPGWSEGIYHRCRGGGSGVCREQERCCTERRRLFLPSGIQTPAPSSAVDDGFMNIPDGVEDEGLPFN